VAITKAVSEYLNTGGDHDFVVVLFKIHCQTAGKWKMNSFGGFSTIIQPKL
jgi:hypothetical protein